MKRFFSVLFIIGIALPNFAFADQVQIGASFDTGYVDQLPDNNFGAHTHVPVGQANNDTVRRALFFMDVAAFIPAGSTINSVAFEFDVTQQGGPLGQQGASFELRRVTAAWTEGSGVGNFGSATGDGATWVNRTSSDLWMTPGGDFAGISSGSTFVDYGSGTEIYSLGNAQLVADVQNMLDDAANNFGFALKAENEGLPGSAMRVTSRENTIPSLGSEARLIIDFTPPATTVVVPDSFTVTRGLLCCW